MIDHARQISVALTVRDLIDPDPAQPGQQVLLSALICDNPLHDARNGPPRHPHQLTHHALRRPRREPRAAVLERMREPGSGPCPRHRRYDHPTPLTFHPRRRRLQEHHHRAGIQRPPPTDPTTRGIPPASPTAPRAPRPRCTGRANRDHQHLLVGALLTLEPKPINRRPFDTKDLPPYPGCAHTVPCPVSGYRPWWPLSNVFRSPPSFGHGRRMFRWEVREFRFGQFVGESGPVQP